MMSIRNPLIILVVIAAVLIASNFDSITLKECQGYLKEGVLMYDDPSDVNETPKWYVPRVDSLMNERNVKIHLVTYAFNKPYFFVGNGWWSFWTPEVSFEARASCDAQLLFEHMWAYQAPERLWIDFN
jgi:hypothetical protein